PPPSSATREMRVRPVAARDSEAALPRLRGQAPAVRRCSRSHRSGGPLACSATPAAATSAIDRPNERRQERLQLIGPRSVESSVMEPPHDAIPVENDQVGIVFMCWRIREPLLPFARASVDRDDVIVEFYRG